MGNVLTRIFQGIPAARMADQPYEPNIPFNIDNDNAVPQNNLNNPHSAQMKDMVLQLAVPLLVLGAYAYEVHQRRADAESLKLQSEQRESELQVKLEAITTQNQILTDIIRKKAFSAAMKLRMIEIEQEEHRKLQDKLRKLEHYEKWLETVLDIRCSRFKYKDTRFLLQDDLISNLSSDEYSGIKNHVNYKELKNIYENDHHFCGKNRHENGKLRQLFVRQWKLQMELEKQRSITERVKCLHGSDHAD